MILAFWILSAISVCGDWQILASLRFFFLILGFILFYIKRNERYGRSVFWASFCSLIYIAFDLLGGVYAPFMILYTTIAIAIAWWVDLVPELQSPIYNKNNVLIGFYHGNYGKISMILSSLFGMPVKSICIIYKDIILMPHHNCLIVRPITEVNLDNYYIHDTQKQLDIDFSQFIGKRGNCVKMLSPILDNLGNKYKLGFWDFIPSLYLRKIVNGK